MKKLLTGVLTAAILLQSLSAVSFADSAGRGTDGAEVLYQNTFSNFEWVNQTTAAPGMVLANANPSGTTDNYYTNLKPYTEADGDKSALLWRGSNNNMTGIWYECDRNGAFDVIPFNKVIKDGKIYVSMDFYAPKYKWNDSESKYSESEGLGGAYPITLFNTSEKDYTVAAASENADITYKGTGENLTKFIAADSECNHSTSYAPVHQSMLVSLNTSSEKTDVATGKFLRMSIDGTAANTDGGWQWNTIWSIDQWHKLQIIIDCDNNITSSDGKWTGNPVSVYIDGQKFGDDCSTAKWVDDNFSGYKGIGLYRRNHATGGIRYDNIYVSHYQNAADVKILEAETDLSDNKASVVFTDNLAKTPEASDFTVKNDKGNVVSGYTVSWDKRKATFDFSNATGVPKNGTMTISANSTLTGAVTQVSVSGSVEITTSGTDVLYQNTFSDFEWVNDTTAAPGMVMANANPSGTTANYYTNLKPYTETDGDKSALFWRGGNQNDTGTWEEHKRNGAFDVIPFNKIVKDGKIHVSMDFYAPKYRWNNDEGKYSESDGLGGAYPITLFNTSEKDYTVDYSSGGYTESGSITYKGTGENLTEFIAADSEKNHSTSYAPVHQSMLVSLNTSSEKTDVATGKFLRMSIDGTAANTDGGWQWNTIWSIDQWHKLDIVIDCDSNITSSDGKWTGNPVSVYIDGQKFGNDCSTAKWVEDNFSGYKGIGLYRRNQATGGIRYDNIYVSHYSDSEDSVKILAAETDMSDKKVSAAFTEYLNKAPEASDFEVVTNAGTVINGYTVSGDRRKVTFDFTNVTNLPADGRIIITPKNTLKGAISGVSAGESMEIPLGFSGTNVFEVQDEEGEWAAAASINGASAIRAHVNVTNGYAEEKTMLYIVAKYATDDDGTLILSNIVKCESVTLPASGKKEVITEITPESGAIYKAFVWGSTGYFPFMESAEIQ